MTRPFFIAAVLSAFIFPVSAQDAEREDLRFLVIEALSNNPEIAAELAKMDAASARVPQAGSLTDPEIRIMQKEMPGFALGQALATTLEFMQMVRFPTKLFLQSDIAEVQAEHAHHEHLEKVLDVIRKLKFAYAELWYTRTAIEINKDDQALLQQIVRIAQTQYSVGRVSQSEVLKMQIELAKVQAESANLVQEETGAASRLRALLNRDSSSPVGSIVLDSLTRVSIPVDALIRYALVNKPMIVHDSLRIHETSLMLSMARQEYLPDFKFSVEYMRFAHAPQSRWSVSAGITIPFAPWTLGKASSRVEEAQAEVLRRDAMFRASRNMAESAIHSSYARGEAAEVLAKTYQYDLIPQTRQSLNVTLTEYQTGQTGYLMLLDSYRTHQMTRMESARARMRYEQAVADLEYQVGVMDLSIVSTMSQEN